MAVCFFNDDYSTRYDCTYAIEDGLFIVNVKYTIEDELEPDNGVIVYGPNTAFDDRDILVIDRNKKEKYLLKRACYAGFSRRYGHPDGDEIVVFKSRVFLSSQSVEFLQKLKDSPKVKVIRIESDMLIDEIRSSRVRHCFYEKEEVIHLSKEKTETSIDIKMNNIERISLGDSYRYSCNQKHINIDITGYIDIKLRRRVRLEEVSHYVNELVVYMQLYKPNKFVINTIQVKIDDDYCVLSIPVLECKETERFVEASVDCDLISFLSRCYEKIPYRKGKEQFRNIPYIVLRRISNIEDSFLSYYRFIERYYKGSNIAGANNRFVEFGLRDHAKNVTLDKFDQEKLIQEIISLRNQYVHSGYYLKNACLRVKYPKIGGKKNPKNYTVNGVDVYWIHERVLVLREIAIDIVFKDMLGFDQYRYK